MGRGEIQGLLRRVELSNDGNTMEDERGMGGEGGWRSWKMSGFWLGQHGGYKRHYLRKKYGWDLGRGALLSCGSTRELSTAALRPPPSGRNERLSPDLEWH